MEEKKIKFTLLLATLNRPQQLRECVECLLAQTYTNYEIIIVDQSPDEYIDVSIAEVGSQIRYIRIQERGLSHARNVGLKYASGDYVCLVDDDGLYAPDVLEKAERVLKQFPIAILIGKIVDPKTKKIYYEGKDGFIDWKKTFKCSMSPSMIIERSIFDISPFDERFGVGAKYGAGEETDIIFLAQSSRKRVYFTNSYEVYHNLNGVKLQPEARDKKFLPYVYGVGALNHKILKEYSALWGAYHFLRALCGNILYGYVLFPFLDAEECRFRRKKVSCIYRGFRDYHYTEQ